MAIGYTARGTGGFTDNAQATSVLTISVTVGATGSALVFGTAYDGGDELLTATWNGISMTQRRKQGVAGGGGLFGEVWDLFNVTAGTHNLVLTWNTTLFGAPQTAYVTIAEVTGCTTSPYDVSASASGSSTTPSSGGTGGQTQSFELCYGIVATAGPQADTAGTWSNSWIAGQRIGDSTGTSHSTCSEGYIITSINTAQTAAKTGITSRIWRALIVTYKQAATNVTVTLDAGSATATGRAMTAAMGGISLTLDVGSAVSSGSDFAWLGERRYYVNPGPDIGAAQPAATQEATSIGIWSRGRPYFALINSGNTGIIGPAHSENTLRINFALKSAPMMLSSPNESHGIWSMRVGTTQPHTEIGVTPSLAIFVREYGAVMVTTPVGAFPADGQPHLIEFYRFGPSTLDVRGIKIDGTTIVEQVGQPFGTIVPSGDAYQVIFFNGIDGIARYIGQILYAEYDPDGTNLIRWMFNEGSGPTVHSEELILTTNQWVHIPDDPLSDYPGSSFDCTAQFYVPTSQPWGPVSPSPVSAAYAWGVDTGYNRVRPNDPTTPPHLRGADVGFNRGLPFSGNYQPIKPTTEFTP